MNYENIALENMNLEERAAYWDELDKQQRKRDKIFVLCLGLQKNKWHKCVT